VCICEITQLTTVNYSEMSASVMWKHFNDIMQMAIDKLKFVPKKKKEKKPLWMTGSVLRTVKKKHKLWKKWRKTKDANTELKYKKQVNKASKAVKLAKRNFEKQIAKKIKSDPKSFYSYVKSKTKFKSTVGPLTNDKGDLVGDYREMAELLNTFFASVFTTENTNNLPDINNIFLYVDSERHFNYI